MLCINVELNKYVCKCVNMNQSVLMCPKLCTDVYKFVQSCVRVTKCTSLQFGRGLYMRSRFCVVFSTAYDMINMQICVADLRNAKFPQKSPGL